MKMKDNYRKLGDIVKLIDERNKSRVSTDVLGISIDKEFIPSVANTIGTDLSNYKVLKKNRFACNPMHVGRDERLPVSLYSKDIPAIVSPAYFMFEIADTKSVSPEYLMLNFKRADFDRNCWFRTDGSVRGGITWDDLCELELPVPDLTKQQRIVIAYNTVDRRIRLLQQINKKLEATAQTIYRKMYIENKEKNATIEQIYQFQYGKGNNNPDNGGPYPIYGSNGIIGGYTEYNAENIPVIGHIGSCGSLCFAAGKIYVTYNGIMCNIINPNYSNFGYFTLRSLNLLEQVRGSTQPFISYDMLYEMKIFLPNEKEILFFEEKAKKIMAKIIQNNNEISKLHHLQQLMVSLISNM